MTTTFILDKETLEISEHEDGEWGEDLVYFSNSKTFFIDGPLHACFHTKDEAHQYRFTEEDPPVESDDVTLNYLQQNAMGIRSWADVADKMTWAFLTGESVVIGHVMMTRLLNKIRVLSVDPGNEADFEIDLIGHVIQEVGDETK